LGDQESLILKIKRQEIRVGLKSLAVLSVYLTGIMLLLEAHIATPMLGQ